TKTIFQACFHGIPASPSGYIEVKLDDVGRLLFFSISGSFPSNDLVEAIDYTLTFDHDVKQVAHKHLKLLELPSSKQEKWLSMYTM
ncbi:glutamine synthetase, partial [Staphylococcus pasteuri]|nr:glutamine synthetase [Staphylococcus pasteuri]